MAPAYPAHGRRARREPVPRANPPAAAHLALAAAPVAPPHQALIVLVLLGQVVVEDTLGHGLRDTERRAGQPGGGGLGSSPASPASGWSPRLLACVTGTPRAPTYRAATETAARTQPTPRERYLLTATSGRPPPRPSDSTPHRLRICPDAGPGLLLPNARGPERPPPSFETTRLSRLLERLGFSPPWPFPRRAGSEPRCRLPTERPARPEPRHLFAQVGPVRRHPQSGQTQRGSARLLRPRASSR